MLKKILIGIAGLTVLGVIAIAIAIWNINPILERLRPQITQTISDAVKNPVQLGELKASLFPNVVVEVHDVALVGQEKDASVKRLLLKTGLSDLLKGKLNVSQLTLEDTVVRVNRKPDGKLFIGTLPLQKQQPVQTSKIDGAKIDGAQLDGAEFDGAIVRPAVSRAAEPATLHQVADTDAAAGSQDSIQFAVDAVTVKNLDITFDDELAKPRQQIALKSINADVKNVTLGETANFAIDAGVLSAKPGNLSIKGTALVAKTLPPQFDVTIVANALDLAALNALLNAYGAGNQALKLGENASLKIKASSGTNGILVALDSLDASAAQIAFGEVFAKAAGVPLTLTLEAQPSLLGAVLGNKLDVKLGDILLSAPFTFDPIRGTAATVTSNVKLASLEQFLPAAKPFALSGSIKPNFKIAVPPKNTASAKPKAEGTVAIDNVGAVVTQGPDTKLVVSGTTGTIELSGETVKIPGLVTTVANQKLALTATATPLDQPLVEYTLKSDNLALGPLLSSVKPGGIPALSASSISGLALTGAYSTKARGGKADLQFAKGSIAGTDLSGGNLGTQFQLGDGNQLEMADLKPSILKVFGGQLDLQGSLKSYNAITAAVKAAGLQLEPISKVAMPGSSFGLQGLLEGMSVNIQGDKRNLKQSMNGQISARAVKGAITGVNILREILQKVNAIPGVGQSLTAYIPEQYRPLVASDATQFDTLVLNSGLGNGAMQLRDFTLTNAVYILSGQGQIGFDGKINLDAQLKLTPAVASQMVLREPKLQLLVDGAGNIVIPVVIKKDEHFVVLPDLGDLTKRAATNTAKEAAKRGLDRVQPGLGKALDSLFK